MQLYESRGLERSINMASSFDSEKQDRRPGVLGSTEAEADDPPGPGPGGDAWQYVLGLSTTAIFICYADRSNISIAILTMAQEARS